MRECPSNCTTLTASSVHRERERERETERAQSNSACNRTLTAIIWVPRSCPWCKSHGPFLHGLFSRGFSRAQTPIKTFGKRTGKRLINEGKLLMGCFEASPPWVFRPPPRHGWKTAPRKRPIKRSMEANQRESNTH